MDWANTLANANDKRNIISTILSVWSKNDMPGALAYTKQLPDGQSKQNALRNISQQWAQQDPQAAMEFVDSLPMGLSRTELLGNVINGWFQQDPEAAANYVQIANGLAQSDPQAAAAWAAGFSGETRQQALGSVIQNWARLLRKPWLTPTSASAPLKPLRGAGCAPIPPPPPNG